MTGTEPPKCRHMNECTGRSQTGAARVVATLCHSNWAVPTFPAKVRDSEPCKAGAMASVGGELSRGTWKGGTLLDSDEVQLPTEGRACERT